MRTLLRLGGLLLALLLLIGLAALWFSDSRLTQSGEITIAPGEPALEVWRRLSEEGYTSTGLAWRYQSWRQQAATQLKAGRYLLARDEAVKDVVARFLAGDALPDEFTLTFPEGFTLAQMARRTAATVLIDEASFLAAAESTSFASRYSYLQNLPAGRSLEGYLFPDTYHVLADDTAADIIARLLANFDQKLNSSLRQQITDQGRTLDQVVIMASLIEREVRSDTDMAAVSDVLWKRFDDGVGLGVDATVRYALDKWDEPLTVADLQIDSPYNTRRFAGLPPGPIGNPGARALLAAINPEPNDYYYYLSAPDGTTIFSKTLDEHNLNKARYLQ
jgi:UPF0755 protein